MPVSALSGPQYLREGLRLVLSPKLEAAQKALLSRFWERQHVQFCEKAAQKPGYEYLAYYIKSFNTLSGSRLVETLKALYAHSTGVATGFDDSLVDKASVDEWTKLPPVIACAILLSDIPRIMQDRVNSDRPRLCFALGEWKPGYAYNPAAAPASLPTDPANSKSNWLLTWKFTYHVLRDQDFNKHATDFITAPGVSRQIKPRLFGWNRNEYAPEVITYRVHLCPIWGGSSGHATGRIASWLGYKASLGGLDTVPVRLTIAASYAALWRLYYDKRVSPVHTLIETLESTFTYSSRLPGAKVETLPSIGDSRSRYTYHEDAFDLLLDCARSGGTATANAGGSDVERAVNPLSVWSSIKVEHTNGVRKHSALTSSLKAQLKTLREQVIRGPARWLPRWAKEKSANKATSVVSFTAE